MGQPGQAASPRDAATVVLLRDGPGGVEALLLERHPDSRFAPGAFAFPGGRVEAADTGGDVDRLCCGLGIAAAAAILKDVDPPGRAIGFWVAALREVFEETGLLLAYDRTGRPLDPAAADREWLLAYRGRCRADAAVFRSGLRDAGLTLATDRMAYYAHWITPEERPIRYSARFFVAAAFPGLLPDPDGIEVVSWRWLTPADALAAHRAKVIGLPFPTQQTLVSLLGLPGVDAALAAARARDVRPIRPRVVDGGGRERILLPGDPGYQ